MVWEVDCHVEWSCAQQDGKDSGMSASCDATDFTGQLSVMKITPVCLYNVTTTTTTTKTTGYSGHLHLSSRKSDKSIPRSIEFIFPAFLPF